MFCKAGNVSWSIRVKFFRKLIFGFSPVNGSVGRTVDYEINFFARRKIFGRSHIGKINVAVGSDKINFIFLKLPGHFGSKHPFVSNQPNHKIPRLSA